MENVTIEALKEQLHRVDLYQQGLEYEGERVSRHEIDMLDYDYQHAHNQFTEAKNKLIELLNRFN